MKRTDNINAVIIKGICALLVFFAIVLLIFIAIFTFSVNGEFVAAFTGEISPSRWFYLSSLSVIFVSSLIYTPFSYGISYYFYKSRLQDTSIKELFYLFRNPRRLFRAIAVDSIKRVIVLGYRVFILLTAVVFECIIFLIATNDFEGDILDKAAHLLTSDSFIILTVLAWCVVIIAFFIVKIRLILCKYVLIYNPDSSIRQCILIGRRAIRGKVKLVIGFYIRYLAIYIFTFLTLGFFHARRVTKTRDSFSSYAVRLVKDYIKNN